MVDNLGLTAKYTYYICDASGNQMATYTGGATNSILPTDITLYGGSRLGVLHLNSTYISASSYTGWPSYTWPTLPTWYGAYTILSVTKGLKEYELTNHLGNVMATISDKLEITTTGSVSKFKAHLFTQQDYMPFGELMPGRTYNSNSSYRFGFNKGSEKDNEIYGEGNAYTTQFREFDTRLGRWWSIDKMAPKLPSWSTYTFGFDNPILYFDFDGRFPFPVKVRAFAPPGAFSGSGYEDDKRGYSASSDVTSRITQTYIVDPTKHTVTGGTPTSSDTKWNGFYAGNATNTTDEGQVDNKSFTKNSKTGSDVANVNASFSGSNPDFHGLAPNIKVASAVTIIENDKDGYIIASVDLSSRQFPATEALISDTKGQTILLTGAAAFGGPSNLAGADVKKVASISVTININNKGEFQSVEYSGKKFSIEDWNKAQEAKPAGPNAREDKDKQAGGN